LIKKLTKRAIIIVYTSQSIDPGLGDSTNKISHGKNKCNHFLSHDSITYIPEIKLGSWEKWYITKAKVFSLYYC